MNQRTNYYAILILILASIIPINFFFDISDQLSYIDSLQIPYVAQVSSALNNGLIVNYTFDEGTGTSITDTVSSRAGTLVGGPTWIAGKVGSGAIQFDGVDDYIDTSNITTMNGLSAQTVCAWVRLDNAALTNQAVMSKISGSSGLFFQVTGASSIAYGYNSANFVKSPTGVLQSNTWQYWCGTFDDSLGTGKHKIYLDGNLLTTTSNGTPDSVRTTGSNTENFQVNKLNSYNRWLKGSIDDIRVYNRALSQQEISELFANTVSNINTTPSTPPPTTPSDPVPSTPTAPTTPTTPTTPTSQTTILTTPSLTGIGYIEAESGVITGTYKNEGGYIYNTSSDSWQATYTVNVPSDDNYYVAIVANFASKFDRFTVKVNNLESAANIFDTDPIVDGFLEKRVYWSYTKNSNFMPLSAGSHQIQISGVSANVKIDKIRVVKFSDMYANEVPPSNIITSGKAFVIGGQMGFEGQDPVVWTRNTSGYAISIRQNLSKASGLIRLPGVLSPGTYNIFVKVNGGQNVQLKLGDIATARTKATSDWTLIGSVTTTSNSNQLFIDIFKSGDISLTEASTIEGIYITNNLTEKVIDGVAIDLSKPSADTSAPTTKSNLISNSSFEVGIDANWGFYSGKRADLKSQWDTSTSYDGRASFRIPLDYNTGWPQFATRAYNLKPNKKYTFSFWAKTNPGKSLPNGLIDIKMLNTFTPPKTATYGRETVLKKIAVNDQWQRFSITGYAIAYPTSDYQFLIETNGAYTSAGPSDYLWIDAVQLEEGDLGDTYVPSHDIEVMINTLARGGIFYNNQAINGQINIYNAGTSTQSGLLKYEIYDYLNTKVKEGSMNINSIASKAYQSYSIDLGTGKNGAFRIVYWIEGINGSDKELVYSVVPQPAVSGPDIQSYIGIHAHHDDFQMDLLKKLGIKWTRVLSPGTYFRWNIAEPTEGNFVWYDREVSSAVNNGITILGTIHGAPTYGSGGTALISRYGPTWAMDSNGLPNLTKWENYVRRIVDHYKPYVKYWEVWNEPNQQKTSFPLFSETFYADLLKRTANVIKSVDPSAKIVAMGGTDAGYMQNVYAILEAQEAGWVAKNIEIFSAHAYPGGHSASSYTNIINGLKIPVWNTEAGAWDLGFYQGDYASFLPWGVSANISERFSKGMLTKPEDLVKNFVESIGNGMTKYFYYDSRIFSSLDSFDTHPTIFEYDGTLRPKGVAYAVSASFIDKATSLGNLKLNNSVSAYLFDKSGTPTLVIWSNDKLNRQLRTTLNSGQYTVYDLMGNVKSTPSGIIEFGRTPIYVVGRSVTVNDFQNRIKTASIESRSDTLSPKISISTGPRGVIKDSNFRFRWFALDETHVPQAGTPDNPESYVPETSNSFTLYYQYRLVGFNDSWSPWTTDIYYDYTAVPSGTYKFEVRARDGAGNISSIASRDFIIGEGVIALVSDPNPCSGSSNNPLCPVFIPVPLPQGTDALLSNQNKAPVVTPVEASDSDLDSVIDIFDKCPNTPAILKSVVNNYGCPRPKVATFDIKPDFNSDISRMSNLEIGKKLYGKIQFKKDVQVLRITSSYKDQLDIDSNLIFNQNKVTLDSAKLPELNTDAVITLYNVKVKNPKILKDGKPCTTCTLNSYSNGTLVFTVTGFSTYEVIEGEIVPAYVPIVPKNPVNPVTTTKNPNPSNNLAKQAIKNSISTSKNDQIPVVSLKTQTLSDKIDNYINDSSEETGEFTYFVPSYGDLLADYIHGIMKFIADFIISIPRAIRQ